MHQQYIKVIHPEKCDTVDVTFKEFVLFFILLGMNEIMC